MPREFHVWVRPSAEGLKLEASISRSVLEALLSAKQDTLNGDAVTFTAKGLDPDADEEHEYDIVQAKLYLPD